MSGSFVGFILEVLVATLLLATIVYCIIVNRKLDKLRADQENLKSIIRDLNQSTLHAEAATSELRLTVDKASKELGDQIDEAESSTNLLRKYNEGADDLLKKLTSAVEAAKTSMNTRRMEHFEDQRNVQEFQGGEFHAPLPQPPKVEKPFRPNFSGPEPVGAPQEPPLRGVAMKEEVPAMRQENQNNEPLFPKLRLSALSSQGMPEPGQNQPVQQPVKRRRFQWDQ